MRAFLRIFALVLLVVSYGTAQSTIPETQAGRIACLARRLQQRRSRGNQGLYQDLRS